MLSQRTQLCQFAYKNLVQYYISYSKIRSKSKESVFRYGPWAVTERDDDCHEKCMTCARASAALFVVPSYDIFDVPIETVKCLIQ